MFVVIIRDCVGRVWMTPASSSLASAVRQSQPVPECGRQTPALALGMVTTLTQRLASCYTGHELTEETPQS